MKIIGIDDKPEFFEDNEPDNKPGIFDDNKPGIFSARISDLNLNGFHGIDKIEGDIVEKFYILDNIIGNAIRVRYDKNTGIIQSLTVKGEEIPVDNPEVLTQFNNALELERQRQQKNKYKVTVDDLTPVALYGYKKVEGDIIETFNMVDMNLTTRVKYNGNTGEVYFVKVNGKDISLDSPLMVADFNEYLEALVPPESKKSI